MLQNACLVVVRSFMLSGRLESPSGTKWFPYHILTLVSGSVLQIYAWPFWESYDMASHVELAEKIKSSQERGNQETAGLKTAVIGDCPELPKELN